MIDEEKPPTEAELREAESLARALEDRIERRDAVPAIEDALATAHLLRASSRPGLDEVRARAVLKRVWATSPQYAVRTTFAALAAAAAVALVFAIRPGRAATLPPPPPDLLRAHLGAARPGSSAAVAQLDSQMSSYREQVFGALQRAYGGRR
jgi:hypothetical protein